MAPKWIEAFTGSLEQKKQYKHSAARIDALDDPYRTTAKALHRYILASGGIVDGATMVTMFADLADLWEQAAADGTPVREVVGENPADFADTFVQAYAGKHWADKERQRLTDAIDDVIAGQPPEGEQ